MPVDLHSMSIAKFTYAFQCLDADGTGALDATDFLLLADRLAGLRGWVSTDPRLSVIRGGLVDYWEMLCMLSDHDGSGAVDLHEFLQFHQMMIAETHEFQEPPPWALAWVETLLAALDANGDGRIDRAEYAVYLRAIRSEMDAGEAFCKLDLDSSGFLELDELRTLMSTYLTSTAPEEPGNYLLTGGWPA
jgi:Ca2+-binding EF-hand superfamily protein